jgi:hypothetical protein
MQSAGLRMNVKGKIVRKEGCGFNIVSKELFFPASVE